MEYNGSHSTNSLSIESLMRPSSVAIIGVSTKSGTAGQVVLNNLVTGGYDGDIFLVGRSGGEIDGRPILSTIDELPLGVELAILVLPSAAVLDTVKACVQRRVKAAVCFASGFAEMGTAGRELQQHISDVARDGNLTLLGPNTVGYFNYVDAFYVMMVQLVLPPKLDPSAGPAIAVVAQSGGVGTHVAASLRSRGVPLSYMMTTGNEAQLSLAELIEFFAEDKHTGAVIVYAEQIRSATSFLTAVEHARRNGKGVVLLHPGRSQLSQEAAKSHTGALAGNHAAMQLITEYAGVVTVDSLEEAIDVGQLLLRYPEAPSGGLGLVTASGAICGLLQDYVEPLELDLPPLGEDQILALKEHLPDFLPPRNPLDLGTLFTYQPELIELGVRHVLADPKIGSLIISLAMPGPEASVNWLEHYLRGSGDSQKPAIFVMQNEDVPLAPAFVELAQQHGAVVMRSPERAVRALARFTRFGRSQKAVSPASLAAESRLPHFRLGQGPISEWRGKEVLSRLGVRVPDGALATGVDEALVIANRVGYPVVLKAQEATLAHKSEVGGVLLNIKDNSELCRAWSRIQDNVHRALPGLNLDGVLVETMNDHGLELVVGASRDSQWGPIIMVGLGGVWVEALGDVKLLPPGLPASAIVERLQTLKASKLLNGFRGSRPVDLQEVARVVSLVGRVMQERPEILEIDINPLVVYSEGQGAAALDALFICEDPASTPTQDVSQ